MKSLTRNTFIVVLLTLLAVVPVMAQDAGPALSTGDQLYLNDTVTIANVTSPGPGFVVIYSTANDVPDTVLGSTFVTEGSFENVEVGLENTDALTTSLYAILQADTDGDSLFNPDTDEPVTNEAGDLIGATFQIDGFDVNNQFITEDTLTAELVASQSDGWLVIHADNEGSPGPVIGQTAVAAGVTPDVVVELNANGLTPVLWPMLHVDTGEAGVYEFPEVEGADLPVGIGEDTATVPVSTVPSLTAGTGSNAETVIVKDALVQERGWVVIHANNDGQPGEVIGYELVEAGYNQNIPVALDVVYDQDTAFAMLHEDTGELGVYEFGTVEGADNPILDGEAPVVVPVEVSLGE